jgi:hypothetical protein
VKQSINQSISFVVVVVVHDTTERASPRRFVETTVVVVVGRTVGRWVGSRRMRDAE